MPTRAVASAVATFTIGKLQGEAWVNWLLAQPFRVTHVRDAGKNAFMARVEDKVNAAIPIAKEFLGHSQVLKINTKTPFQSEAEMMDKLADALSAMK